MQQRKLNQKNMPVELANCAVKPARQGEGYEVMLKSSSQIKPSLKKLNVALLMAAIATASKTATLLSLQRLDDLVIVKIKVVEIAGTGDISVDVQTEAGTSSP